MFVVLLFVIVGFCGLALDIGLVYNRRTQLQGIAQSDVQSAARERNRTSAGGTARRLRYAHRNTVSWSDDAIMFSSTSGADADWIDVDPARGRAANKFYVKVAKRKLDRDAGLVENFFMPMVSSAYASVSLSDRAIAGKSTVHVTPLAVRALLPLTARPRTNPGKPETVELVECGFRRGATYDLMQLNPNATTPANFAIDPLAQPGGLGSASNTAPARSRLSFAPDTCGRRA